MLEANTLVACLAAAGQVQLPPSRLLDERLLGAARSPGIRSPAELRRLPAGGLAAARRYAQRGARRYTDLEGRLALDARRVGDGRLARGRERAAERRATPGAG
eukprot:scaffold61214_cov27-Phaeocystis_antarctica.AAC.1